MAEMNFEYQIHLHPFHLDVHQEKFKPAQDSQNIGFLKFALKEKVNEVLAAKSEDYSTALQHLQMP